MVKSICVFCGACTGHSYTYKQATVNLAKEFVANNIRLVYGGAKIGLMGILADTILKYGGEVVGIIPKFLANDSETVHKGLTELIITDDMHDRKALMHSMSDAFIAMPGGYGTLEEILEALTWGQLSIHNKACSFYNVNDYYNLLIVFLKNAVDEGFIKIRDLRFPLFESNPEILIKRICAYNPANLDDPKNDK
jgi:uncharacterized protein (TIGR00730 family)